MLSPYLQNGFYFLGDFCLFFWDIVLNLHKLVKRRNFFIYQISKIGVESLVIVILAALFFGSVLGYQLFKGFALFGAEGMLGASVAVALFRDMAPVFAGVMVIGRAGASMAAEIASMKVSEQLDALDVMGINAIEYVVLPRVVAATLVMPILSLVFAIVASYAAFLVASELMHMSPAAFWKQYISFVNTLEFLHCIIKGTFFGLFYSVIACYFGFKASGGAPAVGAATKATVVTSLIVLLVSDFLITSFLPFSIDDWVVIA